MKARLQITARDRRIVDVRYRALAGFISGACLADVSNDCLCLDVGTNKIRIFKEGDALICEPVIPRKAGLYYSTIGRKR